MFDLSFAELLVIAVVALIVLGPERLPRAARFTGLWVRRARNQWQSVRSEFERELAAEELKRNLDQARGAMRDADRQVHEADLAVRREAVQLRNGVSGAPASAATTSTGGAATHGPQASDPVAPGAPAPDAASTADASAIDPAAAPTAADGPRR